MNTAKYFSVRIGLCGVILIVLLRIAIGWHFFYEGVHKFDPHDEFSSKGFLGQAKGPAAPLYYGMLPDLDGSKRIEIGEVEDGKKKVKTFIVYENAWNKYYADFSKRYAEQLKSPATQKKLDEVFRRYQKSLRDGAADVEGDVKAHLESMKRFEEMKRTQKNNAQFEQVRRWDTMIAYRNDAAKWTNMLDGMTAGLQSDMARVISPQLAGDQGHIITEPERAMIPNPVAPSQMQLLDLSVTLGLTAIGFCMMVGFCNRLACLGGIAFLINVIMTTWPVPGVHPPLPSAVGNFLFVSKDAIELIACLFLASIPAGRWGGLDYFLWNYGGKQLCARFGYVEKCDAVTCEPPKSEA